MRGHLSSSNSMTVKMIPEIFDDTALEMNCSEDVSISYTLSSEGNLAKYSQFLTGKTEFLTADIVDLQSELLYQMMIYQRRSWRWKIWRHQYCKWSVPVTHHKLLFKITIIVMICNFNIWFHFRWFSYTLFCNKSRVQNPCI